MAERETPADHACAADEIERRAEDQRSQEAAGVTER
jgi:hypothetical protein